MKHYSINKQTKHQLVYLLKLAWFNLIGQHQPLNQPLLSAKWWAETDLFLLSWWSFTTYKVKEALFITDSFKS